MVHIKAYSTKYFDLFKHNAAQNTLAEHDAVFDKFIARHAVFLATRWNRR